MLREMRAQPGIVVAESVEPSRTGRSGGLRSERTALRLDLGIAVERIGRQVDKGLVEVRDDRAIFANSHIVEKDGHILEACAANIDQAGAKFVQTQTEHLPYQDRNENLLGVSLDQQHTFGKEQIAAHRVEVSLDITDLAGIETGSGLKDFANTTVSSEDVDVLDIADF